MPGTHRYFLYEVKSSCQLPTQDNYGALLFTLISANHGPGRALRTPFKISLSTALGGSGDTLASRSCLVIVAPLDADYDACKNQVNALLSYLLRNVVRGGSNASASNAPLRIYPGDRQELPMCLVS